jgi:hypothetical protein
MQAATPGGQGWELLKKPSYADMPLKLVVGVLPDHTGMYELALPAAAKSALLLKSVTILLAGLRLGKGPTVTDM